MIQRIQSIFLLIASLALWALFGIPFAMSDKATSPFFEDLLFNIKDHNILLALCIIGGLVSAVSIFMFKNRNLQLRLGYIGIICSLFLAIVSFWLIYSNAQSMNDAEVEDQFGLYLPIISMIFIFLANYFIKKDEKIVDSMDRLR